MRLNHNGQSEFKQLGGSSAASQHIATTVTQWILVKRRRHQLACPTAFVSNNALIVINFIDHAMTHQYLTSLHLTPTLHPMKEHAREQSFGPGLGRPTLKVCKRTVWRTGMSEQPCWLTQGTRFQGMQTEFGDNHVTQAHLSSMQNIDLRETHKKKHNLKNSICTPETNL